jgi:glutaconyl-CoA decarboxylase
MKYKVTLNGRTYEVEVEAGKAMCVAEYEAFVPAAPAPVAAAPVAAAPVAAAPAAAPAAAAPVAGEAVTAPMPGNILKVVVTAGQAVKEGDLLLVLEAMKMENEIFAPKDGTVAQVLVSKGSTVDTGATMVVLN